MSDGTAMTDAYNYGGNRYQRASREDFDTLPRRVMEVVEAIPGFEGDSELTDYMTQAVNLYERGDYLFYYVRTCERVLAVPLTTEEKQCGAQVQRYLGRPRWLRKMTTAPALKMRCNWCGRYTPYIDPDKPTFGFDTAANSCRACGRLYPMPSWVWDSPDGRAYSYYRMSFQDDTFYEEFERDHGPVPRCRRRM